jgi:hypothetical protein
MGLWVYGSMGASVLGDFSHYLICHFYFITLSQYYARRPSSPGLWTVDAQWNSENGIRILEIVFFTCSVLYVIIMRNFLLSR